MLTLHLITGILLGALTEYLLHRFYLHKNNHPHLTQHHTIFPGKSEKYQNKNANPKDILSNWQYNTVNNLPALILTIIFRSPIILIGSIAYTVWLEYAHLRYHKPKNTWLEHTKFFKFLNKHHRIHHTEWDYNYNIGSKSWDVVFKTEKSGSCR